jgi:hypothetical protein
MSILDSTLFSSTSCAQTERWSRWRFDSRRPSHRSLAFADDGNNDVDDNIAPPEVVRERIQDIVDAEGSVSDGIFSIEIDRNDITDVTLHGCRSNRRFRSMVWLFQTGISREISIRTT